MQKAGFLTTQLLSGFVYKFKKFNVTGAHSSCVMRKSAFCICEYKGADQPLYFRYMDSAIFFLNPKFQGSNHFLWLYSLVCVRPGQTLKMGFLLTQLIYHVPHRALQYLTLVAITTSMKYTLILDLTSIVDRWIDEWTERTEIPTPVQSCNKQMRTAGKTV